MRLSHAAGLMLFGSVVACNSGHVGEPTGGSSTGGQNGPGGSAGSSVAGGAGMVGGAQGGSAGNGTAGGGGSGPTTGTGTGGSSTGGSGGGTGFTAPASLYSSVRKVKGTLTGLGPTDAEIAVAADPAAFKSLIDTWMATPEFQSKMLGFFSNSFQQSSLAVLDFEFQLRKRPGGFDLPYAIFGDSAFPMLFQNMKESFARTVLQIIANKRPLTDVLTTQSFMMTTALKSLYMQIEMPYDIGSAPVKLNWNFNHGTRPPIEQSVDPTSPNYLTFGYAAPTKVTGRVFTGTCAGDATKVSTFPGSTNLFHVLLGSVDRDSTNNGQGSTNLGCMEHAIAPYFTTQDLSDWQMVTITNTGTPIVSYNLPALRASAGTLPSRLPRVSFFTTPAFLSVWNTNDSNQHRVTANQALLAALGQGFTSASAIIPVPPSTVGLDGTHAVTGSVCYGCHKSLDPMKMFWQNSFDFNDQVAARAGTSASFGFANVVQNGTSLADFGRFLTLVTDEQVPGQVINRFALALTQKLCFFANSAMCEETDPEMRRIALAFQNASYDFSTLVRELFSSPLVTSSAPTATFATDGVTISIARRDQLCGALSNRLAKPDLCEIAMPTPTDVTTVMNRLAGAVPADGFSRGTEFPVTAPDPNLFYRAASELVCEAIAVKVVDAATGTVFSSTAAPAAIEDMVTRVMGVPPSDPNHAAAVMALTDHYTAATTTARATPTNALRSTFSAACQSPTTLSFGI
jgi:hypothetical protein